MAELAVGIAGLAIALPPVVVPIVQASQAIRDLFRRYTGSEDLLTQMQLRIETHLAGVEHIAAFVDENFQSFDNFTKHVFSQLLTRVLSLLIGFHDAALLNVDKSGNLRRIKFAFRGHSALEKLDLELSDWKRRLNDAILTMILIGRRKLPSSLRDTHPPTVSQLVEIITQALVSPAEASALLLPLAAISDEGSTVIGYSMVKYHAGSRPYMTEVHNAQASPRDTRDIAAFLRAARPEYISLLQCVGFRGHTLMYTVPSALRNPRSLREFLLNQNPSSPKHNLEERLSLMKRLASAVLFIHVADHVHKSIRADNVILFETEDQSLPRSSASTNEVIGEPFLVGFDLVRKDARSTEWSKTTDVHKYYYLPPDRQGDPQRKYSMLDDVYSLGVLFLEISLCLSFVRPAKTITPNKLRESSAVSWKRHAILMDEDPDAPAPLQPEPLRRRLVSQAKKASARTMGSTIAGLIVSCLSCLHDPHALGSQEALQDQDGILMGLSYVKQVLSVLDQVNL